MLRTVRRALVVAVVVGGAHAPSIARAAVDDVRTNDPFFVRISAFTSVGDGIRFDNPFRLATQLGDTAASLSRTAPYATIGAAAFFGEPIGVQHGPVLRLDSALTGVGQWVFTPGYALGWRSTRWSVMGRAALPILLSPDANVGAEAGVAGAYFFLAGVGIKAELIGDLFTGAATPTTKHPLYPVASAELGLVVEWERLP
jgi:hypothetical protein